MCIRFSCVLPTKALKDPPVLRAGFGTGTPLHFAQNAIKIPGASRRISYRIPLVFVQKYHQNPPALRAGFGIGSPLHFAKKYSKSPALRTGFRIGSPLYFAKNAV